MLAANEARPPELDRDEAPPIRMTGAASKALTTIPQYPLAGTLNEDIATGLYVDIDPNSGTFSDWNCTDRTYDGHQGVDLGLRTFDEETIGVPVFAALDGTVIWSTDGYDDMNLNGCSCVGNLVGLDHGGGLVTWYYHMKKNSVQAQLGQFKRAGEQIGMVGSSGNSFGPHLHFQIEQNTVPIEGHTGPCNPGASKYTHQLPIHYAFAPYDFGISRQPETGLYPPLPLLRSGQVALGDPYIYFWWMMWNLPANATWRVEFIRPDQSVAFDSLDIPYGNSSEIQNMWNWWQYDIADMHTITGTWSVRFRINGQVLITAPVDVVASYDPNANHAPEPITAVFDPIAPTPADPLYVRVTSSILLDDKDYDIVRHRFVWTRNGVPIRSATSAGRADAIPHDSGVAGDVIACTITPNDGKVDGTPTTIQVTLGGGCSTPTVYCAAKTNSLGCSPSISISASPSASSAAGCTVSIAQLIGKKNGLFFHGTNGVAAAPFHGGYLCVKSPIKRHGLKNSGGTAGQCDGAFSEDLDAYIASGADPALQAGVQVELQAWSRDPSDPFTDSLSNAVWAVVCP